MPLRLTANDFSLSGHRYDDILGVRYEFPARYRRMVREGERFVSYRGRRRVDGTTGRPVYLGVGIVGTVQQSVSKPNHLVCDIADWRPFVEPLYFKDSTGSYYEPGGAQGGRYWQPGVRRIPEDVFTRILRDGDPLLSPASPPPAQQASGRRSPEAYASAARLAEVDQYAIEAAHAVVRGSWPESPVVVQAHNNPGYDILVGERNQPERYVEVKGTTLPSLGSSSPRASGLSRGTMLTRTP
jgi:hypothetical protein